MDSAPRRVRPVEGAAAGAEHGEAAEAQAAAQADLAEASLASFRETASRALWHQWRHNGGAAAAESAEVGF